MQDLIIENYDVNTMEHDMKADGHHLKEMKKKILFESRYKRCRFRFPDKKAIIVHVRTIEDDQHGHRSLKVTEHFINGSITENRIVETEMTENEVIQFEKDWKKYWHPKMNQREREEFMNDL